MKFITKVINYEPGDVFTLTLFGDQHRGNVNADKGRMNMVRDSILSDSHALWIQAGDSHDCIDPKDSRRWDSKAIDYSIIPPERTDKMSDEVKRDGAEFFGPIAGKCLVFHRGNHEEYLDKWNGTEVGRDMCQRMGIEDVYSEGMCTTTLQFKDKNKHVAEFVINSAHGSAVPQSDGAGITSMTKKLTHFKDVDLLVRGHSHRCFLQPVASLSRRKNVEDLVDRVSWVCHSASYLQTYAKDRNCYGEAKDYSPTVLLTPRLVFTPIRNKVHVEGRL